MKTLMIEGLIKAYGSQLALRQVSLEARAGEVLAICGENGAGKSTLMAILSGARQPTAGRILIDGKPVVIETPYHAFDFGIRTVYQELSLLSPLSVTENLFLGELPTRNGRISWVTAHAEAARRLAAFGMSTVDVRRPVGDYSVAVQQMIEIAKALVHEPELLILDEPTAVLTARETALLFQRIRELRNRGTLILYISHRLDEVFEIADRIMVLKDGSTVDTMSRAEMNHERLVRSMVGRPIEAIYPVQFPAQPRSIFRTHRLTSKRSFSDVSFDIKAGEIVGFFGLIGSGRTQLARCIFGADTIESGDMELDSAPYRPSSTKDAISAGLGFVTEERKKDGLLLDADVLENGGLASMKRYCIGPVIDRPRQEALVAAKVRELDVRPLALDQIVRNMSGGNQQKVILAKWMLVEGLKLLILDEPTRGVDIATKVQIYRLIAELTATGMAIMLITSDIPELLGLSHRVNVMRAGRLTASFERADASEEKVFSAAANIQLEAAA